jgi:hypothetical protein
LGDDTQQFPEQSRSQNPEIQLSVEAQESPRAPSVEQLPQSRLGQSSQNPEMQSPVEEQESPRSPAVEQQPLLGDNAERSPEKSNPQNPETQSPTEAQESRRGYRKVNTLGESFFYAGGSGDNPEEPSQTAAPEVQVPIENQASERKEVTLTMLPGSLGVMANWTAGTISYVHADSQSQQKGIQAGWKITKVNGQPYSELLLDGAIGGAEAYRLTFIPEEPAPLPPPASLPPPLDAPTSNSPSPT